MNPPGPHEGAPTDPAGRWAPWWVYLVVLLGANYLRAFLVPGDTFATAVTVAVAVAQALVLFALVTIVWRLVRKRG